MRAIVPALLVVTGCALSDPTIGVGALSTAKVSLGTAGRFSASIELPDANDCPILSSDVHATLDGIPLVIFVGDSEREDLAGGTSCLPPTLKLFDLSAFSPALDAQVELRIWDANDEATVRIVGAFAPRTIGFDGPLTAGATVTMTMTPSTDTFADTISDTYPGITVICFAAGSGESFGSEIFAASTRGPFSFGNPKWRTLGVAGAHLSFTVPSVTFHGDLSCQLHMGTSEKVAACLGFGSCRASAGLLSGGSLAAAL